MRQRIREEWRRFREAWASLDRQTLFVLTAAALLVIVHYSYGHRRFYQAEIARSVPVRWRELLSWGWWFGAQGLLGFVIPVLSLRLIFKRKASELGLGLGDWKFALVVAALYVPLVVVGTWLLSDQPDFQRTYPHFKGAVDSWQFFFYYEALFLAYWIGWEYLWRGFVMFGTKHTFGLYAIAVQMVPFAVRHVEKPFAEGVLSVFGGLALGALVWRCRSFWIAVPIHFTQMLCLDLWVTLRMRTGASGVGLDALTRVLGG